MIIFSLCLDILKFKGRGIYIPTLYLNVLKIKMGRRGNDKASFKLTIDSIN